MGLEATFALTIPKWPSYDSGEFAVYRVVAIALVIRPIALEQ